MREDRKLLMVRYRTDDPHLAQFSPLWSLPMHPVAPDDVAEDALNFILHERLHIKTKRIEFVETISGPYADDASYIANIFKCLNWHGEPRFSATHYEDAAWIHSNEAGLYLDIRPELQRCLVRTFDGIAKSKGTSVLASMLDEARATLLTTYEEVPSNMRQQHLPEELSPLALVSLAASAEAYEMTEVHNLLHTPGHIWRPFNEAQWAADFHSRPSESENEIQNRFGTVRDETRQWLEMLTTEQLASYGNHTHAGAITIASCIENIAHRHNEYSTRIRDMLQVNTPKVEPRNTSVGDRNAAADR